ncbi:MAG: prepilin-type N-terminal cleavage/methylation domain-containing protein [Planctomycetota bacterium]|nr:prepilin-type N-terminal cleavage/methylation domain-containing protein [Planctomycetota bacterium]MDA1113477.1 prepilin-type N-terminal cleavage/methylation domain-containing protein [Planctomycetota bacterium]
MHRIRSNRSAGFTLLEIMIATTIAMVLLFGALYSTSETLTVVREGDMVIHTNVHARRALDRILKDFRYSSTLAVSGDSLNGWDVTTTTTGTLDPGLLTYSWNPIDRILTVADDSTSETVLEDLRVFNIVTQTASINGITVITRIKLEWVLGLTAGAEAGAVGMDTERTFELAGATWIRRNDT